MKINRRIINITKSVFSDFFGNSILYKMTNLLLNNHQFPYVRAVTFHDTPIRDHNQLNEQLEWFKKNFVNCDKGKLSNLIEHGIWEDEKPGIILSFDDGLKSNFEVAEPLLKKHGFTGWFMIPAAFPSLQVHEQLSFTQSSKILHSEVKKGEPIGMSWADIIELEKRGHIITCHTMNHKRLSEELSDKEFFEEIVNSKRIIEKHLNHKISYFTWVGGEEWAYSERAFYWIKQAGYSKVFCTNCKPILIKENPYFLERSHLDAHYNLNETRFALGGLYDLFYSKKRKSVKNKLLIST